MNKPSQKVIAWVRWLRLTKKERKAIKKYRKEKIKRVPMSENEIADLVRRLIDTVLPLNEKYQRLLEFVSTLTKKDKYDDYNIQKILDICPSDHPAFVEAFVMKKSRDLLKEIGELND